MAWNQNDPESTKLWKWCGYVKENRALLHGIGSLFAADAPYAFGETLEHRKKSLEHEK
jgi:hypothetical protein